MRLHRQTAAEPAVFWHGAVSVATSWCTRLPFGFIKMRGDKGRFLQVKAEVLQQLGEVKDSVENAEAVGNQLLDHG